MVARRRPVVAPQRPSAAQATKSVEPKKETILSPEVSANPSESFSPTAVEEKKKAGFVLTDHALDIEAIGKYITSIRARTSIANNLQVDWTLWYTSLSWYQKNFNTDIWNAARAKRKAFNDANGTPEDPNGMTSEQMFPAGDPLVKAWETAQKYTKAVAVAASAGVLGVGAFYLNKLRK